MKKFFQYFGFNQIEQQGFLAFSALLILIFFLPKVFSWFDDNSAETYHLVYLEDSPKVYASPGATELIMEEESKALHKFSERSYFNFDPNNLDEDSWKRLGFSEKQIKVIKNYEVKGGKFYKKEDVAKIYVISASDYARIAPYIVIGKEHFGKNIYPAGKGDNSRQEIVSSSKEVVPININTADTITWQTISGIGPVFARRIIKYREALGGFYTLEQLREVYGLPIETFEKMKAFLFLDNTVLLTKIPINIITVEELLKHPYLTKKQAQTIVNYRNQHGNFENLESLSQIQSLDNVFLRKIEPYLEY